jgi:AAA+ superfamily predicted ATPase
MSTDPVLDSEISSQIGTKKRFRESSPELESQLRPKLKTKKLRKQIPSSNKKFTITMKSSIGSDYTAIQKLIGKMYLEQNKTINKLEFIDFSVVNEKQKYDYYIPENKLIQILFNDFQIDCCWYKISSDHGTYQHNVTYLYELSLSADTKEIIDAMIAQACSTLTTLEIHHYDAKQGCFKIFGHVQNRTDNTLIIKAEDKEKLISYIDNFVSPEAEAKYDKFGMPYKLNILLHGKPGTGKTSLANIIANRYKKTIKIVHFDSDLTDSKLCSAVNSIDGKYSILLLEDIDCIFHEHGSNHNTCNVSISALINVLDGISRSRGLITIITTNFIKKLEQRLLRPGRINMMIEFNIISKEQIEGLLKLYGINLDKKIINKLVDLSQKHDLVPATFTEFMFRYLELGLNDTNYIELFKKYLTEIDVAISHKEGGMYN